MKDGIFTPVSDPGYCFTNRQSLPEIVKPNGAVYVFSPEEFCAVGGFPTTRIGAIEMSAYHSIDIDTEEDLQAVEAFLRSPNSQPDIEREALCA
jgi:N-acylneuraminate cytidylyltransferase